VDRNTIYPYLVPGLLNPDQAEICPLLGHGVYVMLFRDHEMEGGIVHASIMPDMLRDAGLTAEEAHRIAMENLQRWFAAAWVAKEEVLAAKMFGNPGDAWNFLLFSGHARAAACLRLPDLYDRCRGFLQSDELCACVSQRESLVVFPKRDQRYREEMVAKLRDIEADARRPISFALFELTPEGVRPFDEEN
jgi:hypothetical protein